MKNIHKKIEKLYKKSKDTEPSWVSEIKAELTEIKTLLKTTKSPKKYKKKRQAYFDFINQLRKQLRADTVNNIYPEIHYKDRRIGANLEGFLYDKATSQILPSKEAFKIYEYLFNKNKSIDSLIIVTK